MTAPDFRPLADAADQLAAARAQGITMADVWTILGDNAARYASPCRITAWGAQGEGETLSDAVDAWLADARRILADTNASGGHVERLTG